MTILQHSGRGPARVLATTCFAAILTILFGNSVDVSAQDSPPAQKKTWVSSNPRSRELMRRLNARRAREMNARRKRPHSPTSPQRSRTFPESKNVLAQALEQEFEAEVLPPVESVDLDVLDANIEHYGAPLAMPGSPMAGHCVAPPFGCGRFWIRAEYLLWWIDGFSAPPLITTSPTGTPRAIAGVLGQPTTTVLLGGGDVDNKAQPGGRIRLGYWFDPNASSGVEAIFWGLGQKTTSFAASSQNYSILARPFYSLEPGLDGPDAELISYPDLLNGSVGAEAKTELQSVEVLYRHEMARQCWLRIDGLLGWRGGRLDEELYIADSKRFITGGNGVLAGTTIEEWDNFSTKNTFNGIELGVLFETRRANWTLDYIMKLALGNTRSEVTIDGSTTITVPVPGAPPDVAVTPAGLLAQQTNIGVYNRDVFSVVPELSLTAGYYLTPNLRATFGYTFVYWSRVARPGDQIDTDLNLSQLGLGGLVGAPRPEFRWIDSDLWTQGLSIGLDYRF